MQELTRKIPEGAEASTILVGAVDFLEKPTIAFVRLAEGMMYAANVYVEL